MFIHKSLIVVLIVTLLAVSFGAVKNYRARSEGKLNAERSSVTEIAVPNRFSPPSLSPSPTPQPADDLWQDVNPTSMPGNTAENPLAAHNYRTLKMNRSLLLTRLNQAPREASPTGSETVLSLPMPDGSLTNFRLEESSVLPAQLAIKYPTIKSYRGEAIDKPGALMRCDWSPRGFHATVLFQDQWISIHPWSATEADYYVSYYGNQITAEAANVRCQVDEAKHLINHRQVEAVSSEGLAVGPIRRTYRLAIATTVEYTNSPSLGGGSVTTTMASINTWVNALNVIYEKELSVRLILAENNDQAIFTAEPDGLTAGDNGKMVDEVRPIFESKLGLGKYDLGQVLSPGSGGLAYIGAVCNSGNFKGGGVTLIPPTQPVGTGYGLITLAHEIGHQFNARHTFSDTLADACNSSQFPNGTAYESYGGMSIMSYAEACTRIVWITAPLFHSASYEQISAYLNNANGGASCAITSNTNNQAPTITAGAKYTIPRATPFALTATGSDPDASDAAKLTYSWEQIDSGTKPATINGSAGPLFRPLPPTPSPTRLFPSLVYILNNANMPPEERFGLKTAEVLPPVARDLNFRCIARDGHGGTDFDSTVITVANAGPFGVLSPNTALTWTGGSKQQVTWTVNNTNTLPINCQNVRISLSLDGGNTFSYVLAASVPNAGTAEITVPSGLVSTKARVKVEAINNIFFDISDADFVLTPGNTCPAIGSLQPPIGSIGSSVIINGTNFNGVSAVKFANNVATGFTVDSDSQITATVPPGAGSGQITLTKASCTDTQTAQYTVIAGAAYLSKVDDGTIESSFQVSAVPQVHYVNRLTPVSYPATITAISLFIPNTVEVGTEYRLVLGLNPGGGSNIDGLPLQEFPIKTPAKSQFVTFPIPATTITGGDFVVGFAHVPQTGVFPVGTDTTTPLQNRSYYSGFGGAQYTLVTSRNFAIRAVIAPGAQCTPQTCPITPSALEGDVSPRPTGNGTVSIADWAQIGRFVAGLDTPAAGSEMQRADCAPRSTFGDGKITLTDWVQAGRYAAGLDPVNQAAGPTSFAPPGLAVTDQHQLETTRVVRIASDPITRPMLRGQINSLPIRFNALGDENALGLTVTFDPNQLSFYRATTLAGKLLTLNTQQAFKGKLGILVALSAGQSFAAGDEELVNLEFIPSGGESAITTHLGFSDQVIACEASDSNAAALPSLAFVEADVSIKGQTIAQVSAASYRSTEAAADSIISAFGSNLAITSQSVSSLPLPTTLGGTTVTIKDSFGFEYAAPLFFVSPSQINYLIPADVANGLASVTITNAAGLVSRGVLNIERVAPSVFTADSSGKGCAAADVQYSRDDGTTITERAARFDPVSNQFLPNPIRLLTDEQVFLILYGTGLRHRSDLSAVKARIGGIEAEVLYAGPQGTFAGLDQINLRLPTSLSGRGEITVEVEIDGRLTNPVKISIQ